MNKKFSKIFAMALALILCMAMTVPAFAFEYNPLVVSDTTKNHSTTIDKYLVLDKNATVPAVEFEFSIEQGTAVKAEPDKNIIEIKPGPMTPSISKAAFTYNQETFDTVQEGDTLTLNDGKAYAKSTFTVNLEGVTFDTPGVYRYVITETTEDGNGFTVDKNSRYLDVTIVDNNGILEISRYELLTTDSSKSSGFENSMETYDLTISKAIAGNQGDKTDTFEFTLKIEGAKEGDTYNAYLNGTLTTITVDENGEYKFTLGHNDSLKVTGLNYGTKWTVTEDAKDYTPSVDVSGDTDASGTGNSAKDASGITADTTVAFTNTNDGIISTGILLTVAPFIVLMLVGIAGVALIIKRKSRAM